MTEQNEQKHYQWNEGSPTGPDVEVLMKAWPDLKIGDRLTYQDVSEVVGIEIGTNRWSTVTDKWRKRLGERGLVVECERSTAFYVATTDQITASSHGAIQHIVGTARKQRKKLSAAKPETEVQSQTVQHQGRLFHTIERETRKHRMNLLPSTKQAEQPRIQPPEKKSGPTQADGA